MTAVQAESLEVVEKADVPPGQARAIVRAIEIELGGARDVLATKEDVRLLRLDLKQEIESLRQETKQEIQSLRHEMKENMTDMRRVLEVKIEATARNNLRQMYMALFAQMGILVGIVYALTHAGH